MEQNKRQGTDEEISFWKGFVKTDRFLKGWVAPVKTPELRPETANFIIDNIPMHGSILDCGSGVVSILNGLLPGNFMLLSTDLLAEEYERIFDYKAHGITPPIPVAAEDLPFKDQFDIVHMSNALDHTQEPWKAYESMLAAVKPGGFLIIEGFENEGEFEKWQGMHQWNIAIQEKIAPFPGMESDEDLNHPHLVITANPNGELSGRKWGFRGAHKWMNVPFLLNGKNWFIWIVKK